MTNAELAILALVAEKPCYGYQIEQIIEQRGMREWTEIGFSSIYYLLRKLESKKLVSSQLDSSSGGPARKVYTVTKIGGQALLEAGLEILGEPVPSPRPLLLGLSLLPMLEDRQALKQLAAYREKLAQQWSRLNGKQSDQQSLGQQVNLMFDYSLAMIEAELEWIEKMIDNYPSLRASQFGERQESDLGDGND